jgi:hypothetical protein
VLPVFATLTIVRVAGTAGVRHPHDRQGRGYRRGSPPSRSSGSLSPQGFATLTIVRVAGTAGVRHPHDRQGRWHRRCSPPSRPRGSRARALLRSPRHHRMTLGMTPNRSPRARTPIAIEAVEHTDPAPAPQPPCAQIRGAPSPHPANAPQHVHHHPLANLRRPRSPCSPPPEPETPRPAPGSAPRAGGAGRPRGSSGVLREPVTGEGARMRSDPRFVTNRGERSHEDDPEPRAIRGRPRRVVRATTLNAAHPHREPEPQSPPPRRSRPSNPGEGLADHDRSEPDPGASMSPRRSPPRDPSESPEGPPPPTNRGERSWATPSHDAQRRASPPRARTPIATTPTIPAEQSRRRPRRPRTIRARPRRVRVTTTLTAERPHREPRSATETVDRPPPPLSHRAPRSGAPQALTPPTTPATPAARSPPRAGGTPP